MMLCNFFFRSPASHSSSATRALCSIGPGKRGDFTKLLNHRYRTDSLVMDTKTKVLGL
ncbi:hypothetical protein SAMN05444008_12627 [Cnuella takakiae]|uniref:Uncharacterized protein n=1 Tax=Cnuella takakiae TaxID=1302690 RepID=A0A1M5IZ44_9BACT|nr:hypothetical protein SAMN05444008_12627 [Cnuella takakiae]